MNRKIGVLLLSIIICISVIVISIPFWMTVNGETISLLAEVNGDLKPSLIFGDFESLKVVDDENAIESINPTTIYIKNQNGHVREYDLYLSINKESTINYQYIRISINDTIYNLSTINMEEIEDNYYFKLYSGVLESYQSEELAARIWLSTDIDELAAESSVTINFVTK